MSSVTKSSQKNCPDCGLTLPKNAPAGLCPSCLLRAMMAEPDSVDSAANPNGTEVGEPVFDLSEPRLEIRDMQRGHSVTSIGLHNASSAEYPEAGTTLRYFGDYELHEEIARGGMGVVYRARQVRLNRRVALKMIRAGKFSSGTEIQRLRVEAEAAAQLDHPAIVPVFEVGEHEGLHYFTMAFVDGETLSAKLGAGPMPVRAAARLMQTVAEAVAYAHEKGVIHRDLKPGNILIDQSGQPRVSDFGLAKQVSSDNELTTTGQILGTPSYMPPEQALGKVDEVGRSSDIYSLGAVLYATLTGRPPFQAATSVETLRLVVEELPLTPRLLNPSIPRDLETICLKCLEKSRSRRYPSAKEVAEELDRFLSGDPILAQPAGRLRRLKQWYRRHWAAATMGLVVLFSVSLVAAVLASTARKLTSELQKTSSAEASERRANMKSQELLWLSYLSEANAKHRSRQSGQRFGTLEAIRNAMTLPVPEGHSLDELRTEAIAALCLPDIEVARRIPCPFRTEQLTLSKDFALYGYHDRDSGEFIVRESESGEERFRLDYVNSSFDYLAQTFSPDSMYIVYPRLLKGTKRLCVWQTTDGKLVADLGEEANCFEFRSDMKQLAVANIDGTIRILDCPSFSELSTFVSGLSGAEVAWNPFLPQVLAMGQSGWKVIDLDSGKTVSECAVNERLEGWPNWFRTGQQFVAGMQNMRIGIWDSASARLYANPLRGHTQHGIITRLCPDESQLVSNDWNSILRLWDLRTGRQMLSVPARGTKLQFSPDGNYLGADQNQSELRIFRYDPGREFSSISSRPGDVSQFGAQHSVPCLNANGRIMAVRTSDGFCLIDLWHDRIAGTIPAAGDGPFRFHQTSEGEQLWTYGRSGLLSWPMTIDAFANNARIGPPKRIFEFLPVANVWGASLDGDTVLIPFGDGAMVWKKSLNETFPLKWPRDVRTCAVSPDGRLGFAGSHSDPDVGAAVWDLTTRKMAMQLLVPPGSVFLSPDGKWLVTNGGQTRLWEFGNWKQARTIHPDGTGVCFSPDSRLIAVSDGLSQVRLMKVATAEVVAVLTAPQMTRLLPLMFTKDSGRLITLGSETGELHIFNLRLIRHKLNELGLDWDDQPLPTEINTTSSSPLRFEVVESSDGGKLAYRLGALPTNSATVQVARATTLAVTDKSESLNVLNQSLEPFGKDFPVEDHLLINGRQKGDYIEFSVPYVPRGKVRLLIQMTQSYDFGIVGFYVNGEKSEVEFDGYSPDVRPSPQIQLGQYLVKDDQLNLRIEVIDSNPLSSPPHHYFAVSAIIVEQIEE